jgi:fatty acid desaturase
MKSYRHYHLRHHRYAQTEKDPDLGLSSKFPVSRDSLMRKLFRDITGQTYLRIRLAKFSKDKSKQIDGSGAFENTSPWPSLIINVVMFAMLANWGVWWAYFVLWALPLMPWFFAVIRIRNIAEHGMTSFDSNPLTHARTTQANMIERVFFAPYYVNYHVEHHAYMYVPCYNFPALHRAMKEAGHGEEMETKSGYGDVLRLATTAAA